MNVFSEKEDGDEEAHGHKRKRKEPASSVDDKSQFPFLEKIVIFLN